jgi:hypothetical protein
MNKTQLKTVIREFLSSDKDSYVIDDKYKNTFLNKRQEYINALLKNKKNLVKRYGKDAEKVLVGRAIKDAKKYIEDMKKQDIKELVRKSLTKESNNDLNIQTSVQNIINSLEDKSDFDLIDDDPNDDEIMLKYSYWERIPLKLLSLLKQKFNVVEDYLDEEDKKTQYYYIITPKNSESEETINSKKYISEREENPEDKITMDVPLFIRMLEYAREDASTDVDLHDVAEKAIGLSGEDKVLTMTDYKFIVGEKESLNEDDWKQSDDESDMANSQLKSIQSNASKLMNMIDNNEQLDAWVQSKLTKAQDYLQSVSDYLTGEEDEVYEKKLTSAEKNKEEEIVKAMKKDFKGPKPAMYAIATNKAKDLAEIIAKKLKESSYKAPSNSKEAQSLKKGDVIGSGETVVSVSSGAYTPSGKVDVTLEKDGKTRTAVWGKYTKIGVKKS